MFRGITTGYHRLLCRRFLGVVERFRFAAGVLTGVPSRLGF
jgi:hypothetical protein